MDGRWRESKAEIFEVNEPEGVRNYIPKTRSYVHAVAELIEQT